MLLSEPGTVEAGRSEKASDHPGAIRLKFSGRVGRSRYRAQREGGGFRQHGWYRGM